MKTRKVDALTGEALIEVNVEDVVNLGIIFGSWIRSEAGTKKNREAMGLDDDQLLKISQVLDFVTNVLDPRRSKLDRKDLN
jgi:hypothetical protein